MYYALTKEFLPEGDVYPCQREIVPLKDGGQTSVDWVCCPEVEDSFSAKTPILVLLPGLTGDRYDEYVKVLIDEACRRRFKCVVLNHRGCGHTPLTTRTPPCERSQVVLRQQHGGYQGCCRSHQKTVSGQSAVRRWNISWRNTTRKCIKLG